MAVTEALVDETLEDLYEQAPCGYLFSLPDGTIVRVNQTFLTWIGEERDALLSGRRFQDLLTVPSKIFYENQFAPLLRMQGFVREVAFDFRRAGRVGDRDHEPLPTLVSAIQRTDGEGRPALIACTIFDATDRRAYERELLRLRQNAEQLAVVVTSSSDAIVNASAAGIVETWNAGAERLFGSSAAEMIGRHLSEIVTVMKDDAVWQDRLKELRDGKAITFEATGRHVDGELIDISVAMTPHPDLLGNLGAVSAIMRDIRERRVIERLQHEFLTMTTHDLRTPVTGIKANAQLMRRRGQYDERAVEAIVNQADRLSRLIDDLLLATQIEADRLDLRREVVDLAVEAGNAVSDLGAGEGAIRMEASDGPLMVSVDRQRLGQVLGNLLTNALKYSPDDAEIVVRPRRVGNEARVAVIDRGLGIPRQALPHLFDRFYRVPGAVASASGLGLGLYISRRIMEAHGGRIEVESELGVGSTFTLVLPLVREARG